MAETLTLPADIKAAEVRTGMTIRIHQKIKDTNKAGEEKERVQVFEGVVLNVGGTDAGKSMTVRKVASGCGVERIYPLTLPSIQRIEVIKMVKTRRKNIKFVRDSKKRLRDVKQIKTAKKIKA